MRSRRLDIPRTLVEEARAGNAGAQTELLRAAWPAAYRVALALLREPAAAEDAAQEACARALCALADLRRPDRFPAWFYRIVVNEARRRGRVVAREVALDPSDRNVRHATRGDEGDATATRLDVRAAIDALEPMLRVAIVLRYDGGLSSGEIGALLGISPITARWRLMKAHRALRAILEPAPPADRAPLRMTIDETRRAR